VIRAALAVVALLATTGCALRLPPAPATWPAGIPERAEIAATPFHAQDRYQCGPAALATVFGAAGVAVAPESLVDEVYLPARRGSLQTELIAATRRRDLVAYELERSFEALLNEIVAGQPVLVLQNLGIDAWPRWHYAVVIGYDVAADVLLLRSGTTARQRLSRRRFEGSWQRAGRWALVVSRADSPPVTAMPLRWLRAAADLEQTGRIAAARIAQRTAAARWPEFSLAAVALANGELADGDAAAAERTLRQAVARGAADAIVHNNLADLLGKRGCRAAALQAVEAAATLLAPQTDAVVAAAVAATRAELLALPEVADAGGCDSPPAAAAR
jgi:tetratricopeptide (TPR) repeat protein